MKIRSLTYFLNPEYPLNVDKLAKAGSFIREAKAAYESAGYEVQTLRMATIPFPELFAGLNANKLTAAVQELEAASQAQGFSYIALGPAKITIPESYAMIPEIIEATENVFASAEIASPEEGISLPAIRAAAEVITRLAPQDPNGFANLYFTAAANVGPGSPFFPASYHRGVRPAFAVATEAASLAVEAFSGASSLNQGIDRLVASIQAHGKRLSTAGEQLMGDHGVLYKGIDFSLAPFPDEANSIGTAMERMGVPFAGQHGSLAAAAILANAVDQAVFSRVGFSGLLFPQMEDAVLAQRAASGHLSVKDLLMYSAVCGTGLDTIALPGDCAVEAISAVLLDVAALSQRLGKPLTARLMPVPGKQAGEMTSFDFPFFANSRILALDAGPLGGYFNGDESFRLSPRDRGK